MVENHKLNPEDCINIVQSYFEKNFSKFTLIKKGIYLGYWWLEYDLKQDNIIIYFDGDIGGHFSIKIYINNEEYSLWQFDKSVNKKTFSSNENIIYQLEILKAFLL